MRPAILVLALLLCGCASAVEAPPPAAARPDQLLTDTRILSANDMEGRGVGTTGSARARAYLVRRLEEIGALPVREDFEQGFIFTNKNQAHEGVNLIGRIEGTSRSRRVLVVMAHYDHLGIVGGEVFNGADDNASGVAAVLALAESLAADPPRHDVILALVDAEEGGIRGSRVLVSDPPVPLEDIVLAVNFDMLSRSNGNELYAAGAAHFPYLKPRLEALSARAPVTLKLGHDSGGKGQDWTMESDHGAFHEKGIPWVYFGVEDPPEYHKPTDDFDTIPQDFFRRSVQTVLEAVRAFDADLDDIAREAGR